MSFTTDVINELMTADIGKTCCRKAMIFGLFFGAEISEGRTVRAIFRDIDVAEKAAEILKKQFSATPELCEKSVAGRQVYSVSARTKAITLFLESVEQSGEQDTLASLVGFRCDECAHAFLRGVFIAGGTVNDPQKSYHLEIFAKSSARAARLTQFLEGEGFEPKRVTRGERIGLYYKKNMMIADMLYYLGAMKSGFDFSDMCIEHDIRNRENRATNCVARNISRAVETSMKHIEAIARLEKSGKIHRLPEELRYTARLRCENPAASLSELAMLHEPPISKSGLNRRLTRILEELDD